MQILFLSARPALLRETWGHVAHFMPWVDRAVVAAPAATADQIDLGIATTVVTDEELLAGTAGAGLDHTSRNFALRAALARHPAVEDEFIMSDDDYRPLKPLTPDDFRHGDRHRCFAFYDLDDWPGDETPYDMGQHHAREVLGYLGHERLAYGSHMPQLVRKTLLAQAVDAARAVCDRTQLCEWAVYFNIARSLQPDGYADPEPYRTLCWPQYPHEWPLWVRPADYAFENFYPELYEPGHLFDGIPTAVDPDQAARHSVEKIIRWSSFGRRAARLDFPGETANPWTRDSPTRRASFSVLRGLRKAYDYVALDERTRLAELAGAVSRLETEVARLADRTDR